MRGSSEPGVGRCCRQACGGAFALQSCQMFSALGQRCHPIQSLHPLHSAQTGPQFRCSTATLCPSPQCHLPGCLDSQMSLLMPFNPFPGECAKNTNLTLPLPLPYLPSVLRTQPRLLPAFHPLPALLSFTCPSPPPLQQYGPPPYYLNIPNSLQPQGLCTCCSSNQEHCFFSLHLTLINTLF